MPEPDLALLEDHKAYSVDSRTEDPFASPASVASTIQLPPRPHFAPTAGSQQPVRPAEANRHTSVRHDRANEHPSSRKPASMTSTLDSAAMTPMSSMDLEHAKEQEQEPKRASRASRASASRNQRDPEKMAGGSRERARTSNSPRRVEPDLEDADDFDDASDLQQKKAVKILLFLSLPCVLLSSLNTIWALIALVITALTQPIRLCAKRPSFGQQLAGLLGPTLNLQLRCIYTPLPPHANEDSSYHTATLVLVHMLSPFLSFAVMFAAWVLAVYWLSSAIVGDPAGQDKRDDGKEVVLMLRRSWEKWLIRSMKEE